MGEGKYHGQRLNAQAVLQLYAAGERDFRGAILRGGNFRGADLSGADFTGADIRSARFVDATLQKAVFSHTQGGLQKRWLVAQLALVIVIAALAGFVQGYMGALLGYWLTTGNSTDLVGAIAGIILIAVTFWAIARQGFTLRALGSVAVAFAVAFAVAGVVAGAGSVAFAVAAAGAGAIAFAGAVAVAVAVVFAVAVAGAGAIVVAFAGAVAGVVAGAVAVVFAVAAVVAGAGAGAGAVASLLLSIYINRQIHRKEPGFESLRVVGLAFAALGGTSFSGADLTSATFAYATLKSTNLAHSRQRSTHLTRVRWHGAKGLDRARLGTSNLQDPRILTLLTTLTGIDQDLTNVDLCGANLAGAQLHRANLKGANLNRSTLFGAELLEANLTNAQCVGTDFTESHLTGACLEAWNIDTTTTLQDIDCEYVFLKEQPERYGNRERRPHNPDKTFQPGDFEKFFKEMLDTVQILIRNGIYPEVFRATLQELAEKYDLAPDALRSYERKGNDALVAIAVPPQTDKGSFEQDFDDLHALKLEMAKTQGLLEGERKRADTLEKLLDRQFALPPTITIENKPHMNNPISTGDGSFYAGRDVNLTGSTLNLGEISGAVTNQITQLPDASASPDQPSLKDLLTQLQAAVEGDTELSEPEKKEALQAVGNLAAAGQNPKDNAMQRMAKRAATALKAITEPLTEASKLAEVCKTLLPMILALF